MSKRSLNWGVFSLMVLLSCTGCDLLLRIVHKQMAQEKKIFSSRVGYNSKIEELQNLLKKSGCNPGSTDGKIGYRTRAAVKVFQKKYSLKATGYVGEKTWTKLRDIHEEKFSFDKVNVKQIQSALKRRDFNPGLIDGRLGPKTESAIKSFQKSEGLIVDGKVNLKTWEKLKEYVK